MTLIQTFVFMDLGSVFNEPDNLTAVSLLAVPRSQYLDPENIEEPQNKKTLYLTNGFDFKAYSEINNFINQQQKPVCLVSHNGNRFDFPILKRNLQKLNVSLSDDILCADCHYAFYDILKEGKPCRNIPVVKCIDSSTKNKTLEATNSQTYEQDKQDYGVLGISEEHVLNGDLIEKERIYSSTSNVNHTDVMMSDPTDDYTQMTDCEPNEDPDDNNMQLQNEKTPEKQGVYATNEPNAIKSPNLESKLLNPGNAKRKLDFDEDYIYKGKAVRKIFYEGDNKPKVKFTLGAVYDREVTDPPITHHPAENDVYMKFRISHKLGKRFLAWTDQIQRKFADVEAKEVVMRY